LDVLHVQPAIKKIRIDEQNFHKKTDGGALRPPMPDEAGFGAEAAFRRDCQAEGMSRLESRPHR
jgi:hypothetical protein